MKGDRYSRGDGNVSGGMVFLFFFGRKRRIKILFSVGHTRARALAADYTVDVTAAHQKERIEIMETMKRTTIICTEERNFSGATLIRITRNERTRRVRAYKSDRNLTGPNSMAKF